MIIGSTAIKHYFSEFNRIPKDVDIIKQDSFLFQTDLKVELLDNPVLINYYKKAGFIPKYRDLIELFVKQNPDDGERLELILKNIISNKGTFVPEKLKIDTEDLELIEG